MCLGTMLMICVLMYMAFGSNSYLNNKILSYIIFATVIVDQITVGIKLNKISNMHILFNK